MNDGQISAAKIYTDFSGFEALKKSARDHDESALVEVAKQFESVFLQMVLKSMREANEGFKSDLMSSDNMDFYQDMYDQQLTMSLTEGDGIGLAKQLIEQLRPHYEAEDNGTEPLAAPVENQLQAPAVAVSKKIISSQDFNTPDEFVTKLMPYARQAAGELGVEPKVLLAQAALETGWGMSLIHDTQGKNSHNLFSIKANNDWQQDVASVKTLEYYDGIAKKEVAKFRSYPDYQASFNDYVSFLKTRPHYQNALQSSGDSSAFIHGLHKAGYATDPTYADKVEQIMQSKHLAKVI